MTYAYHVTQFNGIDYSTKSAKWNLVAERRTQKQALAVCQTLNQRQPYFHRVEVVKAVVPAPNVAELVYNAILKVSPVVAVKS